MRFLHSPSSPYSVKARLAAALCDMPLELETVDTGANPDGLLSANPLGKIPTLVLEDGTAIFDSRVICEYFDRMSGNLLVPQDSAGWLEAKRLEALADGIVDGAILVVYEARFRPEEKRYEGWTERQWAKAARGLDRLEAEIDGLSDTVHIGHLAVAAALSWLELRFSGRWDEGRPKLRAFFDGFATRFPPFAEIRSKA